MAAVVETNPAAAAATAASAAGAAGRRRGFLSQTQATSPVDAVVHGRLPDWLRGSLLLNGPAVWDLSAASYAHWFDGLALLHRLHFGGNGSVRYHSRFLDSEDARLSRSRGRPEFGGYDTPVSGGLLSRILHVFDPRRTDNGCVVLSVCDGQWQAHTESDRVMRFDPVTLATIGELRWADRLALPLMAAHPCVDSQGRWWNVGVRFGRRCEYVLVSADRRGERRARASIVTERPGYLHAFALSARHALIWECAWRAHPLRFLFAGESYAKHFDWLPAKGSRLHAVSLADGSVSSWDAPPLLVFHGVQAYERGKDIVLDLCLHSAPVVEEFAIERLRAGGPSEAARARHTRFVLSPGAAAAREEALPGRFELPQVNMKAALAGPARYVWAASAADAVQGGSFFDRTIKLDHASSRITERAYANAVALEPLFVPAPGARAEDDGVLLVHTLADNDAGSVLRVLDAATLDERAAVELPVVVPFGFHGAWAKA
ncbi:MAG: carotenoid oxygenase family protein [Burkholderiales bacterium]|nr:carotenoid oxygenase family protein [Burkholderiales bacterium]